MVIITFTMLYSVVSAAEQIGDVGLSNVFYIYAVGGNRDIYFESFSDDNDVWVYSLDDGDINLATEFTLSAYTPHLYVPGNDYIKVVSEEPVRVYVFWLGLGDVGEGGTFYPSDTGSFVGKSFIVFPYTIHKREDRSTALEIYAIETGIVEIRNETDVITFPVLTDTHSTLNVSRNSFYNITSTADIMISHLMYAYWFCVPSTTGQYVGKIHYGSAMIAGGRPAGIYVIAYEPGRITVTNLDDPTEIAHHYFEEAGGYWLEDKMFPTSAHIKIEGYIDTYVQVGAGWGWYGQSYVGGKVLKDETIEYWVLLYENWEGVIFAPEDVTFMLDNEEISLGADEYKRLLYKGGIYHIVSPKSLVIQEKPLCGYAIVPSGIPATKPEISEEPEPLLADNTMIYLAIAVVATLVGAATWALNKTEGIIKYCADCGHTIPLDAKFCEFCGKEVKQEKIDTKKLYKQLLDYYYGVYSSGNRLVREGN
jgi:hypothetical protein